MGSRSYPAMSEPARFPDVMLLTAGNDKALWPVGGLPLVERVMANAKAEGAKRFIANGLPGDNAMLAHFGGLVKVSREEQALGSGGGTKQALPMLHADPFLVMATNSFWPAGSDTPLQRMIERPASPGDIFVLCVHPRNAVGFARSHDFCLSPQGLVTRDYGAPVIHAGVTLLSKSLFADTPDGPFDLDLLLNAAMEREALHGVVLDAPWLHVADEAGRLAAEQALLP
jgi:MurNAc alpha-1-phosphate uridylyltransferase